MTNLDPSDILAICNNLDVSCAAVDVTYYERRVAMFKHRLDIAMAALADSNRRLGKAKVAAGHVH